MDDLGTSQGHSIEARLIRDADGTLYGTATAGGTHNQGTVFRLDAFGVLTTRDLRAMLEKAETRLTGPRNWMRSVT